MHIMDDDVNRTSSVDEVQRNNGSLKSRRKSALADTEKDSDSGKENGPTREAVDEKTAAKEAICEQSPIVISGDLEHHNTEANENNVQEEKKDALKGPVSPESACKEEETEATLQEDKDVENQDIESKINEDPEKSLGEKADISLAASQEEVKIDTEHKLEDLSLPMSPVEDDDMSHTSSPSQPHSDSKPHHDESRKRGSSESDQEGSVLKKLKLSPEELAERDRLVSDFLDCTTKDSLEEIQQCSEKLQQEINTLHTLARAKEQEWNNIIRVRKIKEEMLLRLQRKKDIMIMMMNTTSLGWDLPLWEASDLRLGINLFEEHQATRSRGADTGATTSKGSGLKNNVKVHNSIFNSQHKQSLAAGVSILKTGQNQLPVMMVPVVSSTPGSNHTSLNFSSSGATTMTRISENGTKEKGNGRSHRPILPKPSVFPINSSSNSNNNGQNPVIGEGRQGPILDVRSIIADYRSKHPGDVPRRGRRLKSALSPNAQGAESLVTSTRISGAGGILSMASVALGSGSQMRAGLVGSSADIPDLSFLMNSSAEGNRLENSRPSSADSSRSGAPSTQLPSESGNVGTVGGISFKDVLVQFAKLSQNEQRHEPSVPTTTAATIVAAGSVTNKAPPYPEVTLHPVIAPHSPPHQSPSTSLLHGILTKSTTMQQQRVESNARATTFSPTLARLLTAPERIPGNVNNSSFHGSGGPVSISDLLSTSKTRNEITITPVTAQQPVKTKDEIVVMEEEQEDSADRLVIDESVDGGDVRRDGEDEQGGVPDVPPDEVPECQGCHQRPAQFVCAGCSNQWYCSRDCQVSAWDEHSEMCSG